MSVPTASKKIALTRKRLPPKSRARSKRPARARAGRLLRARLLVVIGGEPAHLASQAQKQLYFHLREVRLAEQMTQAMHQGVGLVAVEEMNVFECGAQLSEQEFLGGEGSGCQVIAHAGGVAAKRVELVQG